MIVSTTNQKFTSKLSVKRDSIINTYTLNDVKLLLSKMIKQVGFTNCKIVHKDYLFTYHKVCKGKTYIYYVDDERKAFINT